MLCLSSRISNEIPISCTELKQDYLILFWHVNSMNSCVLRRAQ